MDAFDTSLDTSTTATVADEPDPTIAHSTGTAREATTTGATGEIVPGTPVPGEQLQDLLSPPTSPAPGAPVHFDPNADIRDSNAGLHAKVQDALRELHLVPPTKPELQVDHFLVEPQYVRYDDLDEVLKKVHWLLQSTVPLLRDTNRTRREGGRPSTGETDFLQTIRKLIFELTAVAQRRSGIAIAELWEPFLESIRGELIAGSTPTSWTSYQGLSAAASAAASSTGSTTLKRETPKELSARYNAVKAKYDAEPEVWRGVQSIMRTMYADHQRGIQEKAQGDEDPEVTRKKADKERRAMLLNSVKQLQGICDKMRPHGLVASFALVSVHPSDSGAHTYHITNDPAVIAFEESHCVPGVEEKLVHLQDAARAGLALQRSNALTGTLRQNNLGAPGSHGLRPAVYVPLDSSFNVLDTGDTSAPHDMVVCTGSAKAAAPVNRVRFADADDEEDAESDEDLGTRRKLRSRAKAGQTKGSTGRREAKGAKRTTNDAIDDEEEDELEEDAPPSLTKDLEGGAKLHPYWRLSAEHKALVLDDEKWGLVTACDRRLFACELADLLQGDRDFLRKTCTHEFLNHIRSKGIIVPDGASAPLGCIGAVIKAGYMWVNWPVRFGPPPAWGPLATWEDKPIVRLGSRTKNNIVALLWAIWHGDLDLV